MKVLVTKYYLSVRRRLSDQIPKMVTHEMVQNLDEVISKSFDRAVWDFDDAEIDSLFRESDDIVEHRTKLQEEMLQLSEALKELDTLETQARNA